MEEISCKNKAKLWPALLVMCIVVVAVIYIHNIQTGNEKMLAVYNNTVRFLLGKEMKLPDTLPITFDRNKMVLGGKYSQLENDNQRTFYCQYYKDYNELYESTGLVMPENESFTYHTLIVYIYPEEKTGALNSTVQFGSHFYSLRGVFKIQDYTEEDTEIGFGQDNWATFIYEYGDGKEAFFLQNLGYDEYIIYFVADDILFELTVPDTEDDISAAKQLIEEMSQ